MSSICLKTYSIKNLYVRADPYVLFMFTNSQTYICLCILLQLFLCIYENTMI